MNSRSPRRALVPTAGLVLLAGLGLAFSGCDERRDSHVREDRIASLLPLAPQTSLRIETRTADIHLVPSPDDTVRVLTVKHVQSLSERSVDALWSQIKVTVERSGSELVLRVREPSAAPATSPSRRGRGACAAGSRSRSRSACRSGARWPS
jgi:hypothetical protein